MTVKKVLAIVISSVLLALITKLLVIPNHLSLGGCSGITLLIQNLYHVFGNVSVSYTLVNLIVNAIPTFIGFKFVGKKMTIYSILSVLLTSVCVDMIPTYELTDDLLLVAIFGGILEGIGISLCLINDTSSGGSDFISMFLNEKGLDGFKIILGVNTCIIVANGLINGVESAMYSIIFAFVKTQVIKTLYCRYQKRTLFIFTEHKLEVCHAINKISNHGASIIDCIGYHTHKLRQLVISVVDKNSLPRVLEAVKTIDPEAFIDITDTTEVIGKFYMKKIE